MSKSANPSADSHRDSQRPPPKTSRGERLAQLGLRFTKGLPENIRELVQARPTGFRFVLSDGKSDRAVPGLYLRVGKSGDSVFWLQYRVKLGPAKGDRKQLKIGAVTLDAARRHARAALARVDEGGDPLAEERAEDDAKARAKASTLGVFFADVYEPESLEHLEDGAGTALRFRKVWGPLFGKPLAAITRQDVAVVIAKRLADGVKPGTLHRDFASIRAALRFAVKRGLLASAAAVAEKPAPIAGKKMRPAKRVRWLRDELQANETESERARFMRELQRAPDLVRTVGLLALATGMRRGEILGLTEAQLHGELIHLSGAGTKTGEDRDVFLNATARKVLAGWTLRGMRGELFPLSRFGGSVLALERKVERAWATVCRKAKVSDFHFHDTRHDFASRLLRSGATLAMVRDALGHSSIAMTERYAHLERRDLRAAVQAVSL